MSILVTTARDILISAFDDISVRMDETTLGASDEDVGVKNINRIMAALDANGVDLGFTTLTKINDPITIPDGAMDALVSILAMRLWPKYRTPEVAQTIALNASRAETLMYKLGIAITNTEYPSTLPVGSGNSYPSNTYDTFYSGAEDAEILSESNGSISLEDNTNE